MTTGRFVLLAALGLGLAAMCFALAPLTNSPVLAVAGVAAVVLVAAARTWWEWSGRERELALMVIAVVAVILIAFLAQTVFG